MNALDPTQIANILAQDKARARSGGGTRTKRDPTEPRVYATWWSLPQSFGTCSNDDCIDEREEKKRDGKAMVSNVKDHDMCRYCFLGGWLSDG